MKVKLFAILFCLAIGFAVPVSAQDLGTLDSIYLVATPLEAGVSDATLQVELWIYNDPQQAALQVGFGWDSEKIEFVAAVASPLASSINQVHIFYDTDLATSNANNRAIYAGISFTGAKFMPDPAAPKLVATYYFNVTNWDVNSTINFTNQHWDGGSRLFFLDENALEWQPVWKDLVIKDVNAPTCGDAPVITCPTPSPYNLCASEIIGIYMPITGADNIDVTGDGGAYYSGDSLWFTPNASGTYNMQVTASEASCDLQDYCEVSVDVTIGTAPVIDCPTATAEFNLCEAGTINIPLAITGSTNVVTSLGTWTNGQLAVAVDASGYFEVTVTATNNDGCGEVSCTVPINVTIGAPPVIDCPAQLVEFNLCAPGDITIPVPITGYTNIVSSHGTWENDMLTISVSETQVSIVTITATNAFDCGEATCTFSVGTIVGTAPAIDCPTTVADFNLCAPGDITIDLPITGAVNVVPSVGIWANGVLTINIAETSNFEVVVTATNADNCGDAVCTLTVNAIIGGAPAIACPTEIIQATICGAGDVTVDLPISGADEVTIVGATWANNQLTFNAPTSDLYTFTVNASNACGADECTVQIEVTVNNTPTIVCPTEPVTEFLCAAGDVCLPIDISNADEVSASLGTVANGSLCFLADTAGTYEIQVDATNGCGTVSCTIIFEVEIGSEPVISCPDVPFEHNMQFAGEICVPLEIAGATSIAVEGATYDAGMLCFQADITELYAFTVTATNDCGTVSCDLSVNVDITPPSADTVILADVPAVPGSQVIVPLTFRNDCFLTAAQIDLSWTSGDFFLDSVSYVGSAMAAFTHTTSIDNDAFVVSLADASMGAEPIASASDQLWANLHFTVSVNAAPGTYPMDLHIQSLQFTRNCGEGSEIEVPEFIAGGILVDTDKNYICGWVVTPNDFGGFDEIEGASVEMWTSYLFGEMILSSTSGHNGAFAFEDFTLTTFDLHAYAEGYYPGTTTGVEFGNNGIQIVLYPLADLVPTDQWVDYYCESNTLMGLPLPVGSVVEAYAQDILCGRQVVTEAGVIRFMPVYRGSDIDDGATYLDIITFKVNGEEALTTGDVIYPADYMQVEVCLEAGARLTKSCDLMAGWNLVSWNINTDSDDIEDLLLSHMDCIDVVLGFEYGGLTYDPLLPQFSTLWQMDHLSGYWVKVSDGCQITLELEGIPVLASTPIPVNAGWNLVSYFADGPLAPIEALASIHENLQVAYGSPDGIQIYKPGDQFNTLDEMNSCYGYWVKVGMDDVLVYPSAGPLATAPATNPYITSLARLVPTGVTPTTSWMDLYSTELTIDGEKVQAGADIAAYTLDDQKIGGFTVTTTGEFGFMPVYAIEAGNQEVSGLKPGEKFYLAIDGEETNETFTWTQTGARYEINLLTSKGTSTSTIPDSYLLGQNYPNPFNPTTSISFNVPASSNAKIEIYNVLGKLVAVPFNGMANAGENTVLWDGRLMNGQTASSGVYFYRLSSDSYTETRKMMLLK